MCTFASQFDCGQSSFDGLRAANLLGNANNGGNAGSLYLNGNNGVSNANAYLGAALCSNKKKGASLTHWSKKSLMTASLVTCKGERHTCRWNIADHKKQKKDTAKDTDLTPSRHNNQIPSRHLRHLFVS